jgi:hypothetical protein
MKRVLADVDAHRGNSRVRLVWTWRCSFVLAAPSVHISL